MLSFERWGEIGRLRFRSLARRERVESELDRELAFHLEQQTAENIARGMAPAEARLAALRRIGGVAQIEEECRDMRRTRYIENLFQDLRYTFRTLAGNPGFTAVMVLTLALSIGANSAIFSVIEGVLLRPLPYPHPDRLSRVFFHNENYPRFPLNPFDFRDLRGTQRSFESMAGYSHFDAQLSGSGEPVRLSAFRVTAGYFQVLGIAPARGREFHYDEEITGNGRSVILSDRLWRNQFGAAPDILGRKILLNAEPYTVVGVMPPGVDHPGNMYNSVSYGDSVDLWYPFTFDGNPARRGSHYVEGIARLKPGVSPEQAQADLTALMADLGSKYEGSKGWSTVVVPLYTEVVGRARQLLLVLLGAVGMVLLIACVNAANLLLAKATARQREIAVRTALGAGRARLIRQMLAESLAIAILGGAAGAALAGAGTRLLVTLLPTDFPRAADIHVNGVVLLFTLAITLATGVIFGLVPALQASRADVQKGLREAGRGSTAGGHGLRLRNALVIAEVSLACVLLIGAGLMLRSFMRLLHTDPGFRPEHVLTASLSLPDASYKTGKTQVDFFEKLDAALSEIPGAQAAGIGTDLPWTGYDDNLGGFLIEGLPPQASSSAARSSTDRVHARYHMATPQYFRALGIPLLSGRFFDQRDRMTKDTRPVLIINQAMARKYWAGREAIGGRVAFDDHPKEEDWFTVVGVVGDVKDRPDSLAAEPAFWWPVAQMPVGSQGMVLAVRGTGDPSALSGQLRAAVHRLDPALAVAAIQSMDRVAGNSFSTPRFALFLVGLFAALALALAVTGIYGVISYSVNQRMHEFGMRMALGARPGDVIGLVLRQGTGLAVAGVSIGLVGAVALAQVLGSLLFEVSKTDPLTFAGVAVVAFAAAFMACYVPARRATAADPMQALRTE
jgi:predicted permease